MVVYAIKPGEEKPYTIPNKGPVPKLEVEEGLPYGTLDIAWVDDSRKDLYHWSQGLKWYERLHAHATMNSARKNVKCKRPFEPKDELDFVLDAAYCPILDSFAEKADPYIQLETAHGEDVNLKVDEWNSQSDDNQSSKSLKKPKYTPPPKQYQVSRRLLRNRTVVIPDKSVPRGHPLLPAEGDGERRENIHHVKLAIAADHSPQTNPGYSRTPSGAFFCI